MKNQYDIEISFQKHGIPPDYLVKVTRRSDGLELRGWSLFKWTAHIRAWWTARFSFRHYDRLDAKATHPIRYSL